MESKMQTGLLLVLGAIVSAIGWMGIYPVGDSAPEIAQALLDDPTTGKLGMLLGYGGMVSVMMGLHFLSRGMTNGGGSGAAYTNISSILFVALIPGFIISLGFEWANTEAANIQEAVLLQNLSFAIGGGFSLVMGIGLLLTAVSIILEKTYHILVAILPLIAGVALPVSTLVDSTATGTPLQIVAWMSFMLSAIVLGAMNIRDARQSSS